MSPRVRRVLWAAFLLSVLLALVVVAVPVWHVRPFRPQSAEGLSWSYVLRRQGPLLTAAVLAVVLALGIPLWVQSRRRAARVALAALALAAALTAWFARQNHFEWMFAPLQDVAYVPAREADFVADDDMVMGVEVGGMSVAYPIRQLAYHHLVNTEVGGTPIVATY